MTDTLARDATLGQLIGKTLRTVAREGRDGNDMISFEAATGERWEMYHQWDCCESCAIQDVVGDLQDLVGSPIVMAEVSTSSSAERGRGSSDGPRLGNSDPDYGSFTWTFYKIATAKGYVTISWYGESNGYYNETAEFVLARPAEQGARA